METSVNPGLPYRKLFPAAMMLGSWFLPWLAYSLPFFGQSGRLAGSYWDLISFMLGNPGPTLQALQAYPGVLAVLVPLAATVLALLAMSPGGALFKCIGGLLGAISGIGSYLYLASIPIGSMGPQPTSLLGSGFFLFVVGCVWCVIDCFSALRIRPGIPTSGEKQESNSLPSTGDSTGTQQLQQLAKVPWPWMLFGLSVVSALFLAATHRTGGLEKIGILMGCIFGVIAAATMIRLAVNNCILVQSNSDAIRYDDRRVDYLAVGICAAAWSLWCAWLGPTQGTSTWSDVPGFLVSAMASIATVGILRLPEYERYRHSSFRTHKSLTVLYSTRVLGVVFVSGFGLQFIGSKFQWATLHTIFNSYSFLASLVGLIISIGLMHIFRKEGREDVNQVRDFLPAYGVSVLVWELILARSLAGQSAEIIVVNELGSILGALGMTYLWISLGEVSGIYTRLPDRVNIPIVNTRVLGGAVALSLFLVTSWCTYSVSRKRADEADAAKALIAAKSDTDFVKAVSLIGSDKANFHKELNAFYKSHNLAQSEVIPATSKTSDNTDRWTYPGAIADVSKNHRWQESGYTVTADIEQDGTISRIECGSNAGDSTPTYAFATVAKLTGKENPTAGVDYFVFLNPFAQSTQAATGNSVGAHFLVKFHAKNGSTCIAECVGQPFCTRVDSFDPVKGRSVTKFTTQQVNMEDASVEWIRALRDQHSFMNPQYQAIFGSWTAKPLVDKWTDLNGLQTALRAGDSEAIRIAGECGKSYYSDSPTILNSMAWAIADGASGAKAEDLEIARQLSEQSLKVLAVTDQTRPDYLDTLATVYNRQQRRSEAITTEEEAVNLNKSLRPQNLSSLQTFSEKVAKFGGPANYGMPQPVPVQAPTGALPVLTPSIAVDKLVQDSDLVGKTALDLSLMRNEIYARHGLIFQKPSLRSHFMSQPWYHGDSTDQVAVHGRLSEVERQNVIRILDYQKSHGLRE